jgi:hypothetical protein
MKFGSEECVTAEDEEEGAVVEGGYCDIYGPKIWTSTVKWV